MQFLTLSLSLCSIRCSSQFTRTVMHLSWNPNTPFFPSLSLPLSLSRAELGVSFFHKPLDSGQSRVPQPPAPKTKPRQGKGTWQLRSSRCFWGALREKQFGRRRRIA